jgi:hypothetical protein
MSTATTTVVRPADVTFRPAIRLALVFSTIKLVLHIATTMWEAHIGWGYFRDEFYYLVCGRHLAWGYVDHGPMVAVQARLAEMLFGHSLVGIRILSAFGGATRVFLTGLLAWSLGGRRPAQALAMICVLVAPQYLGTDSFLSMNSFESLFWMTCVLALIQLERGRSESLWWLIFGVSGGIGLLNKHSMVFFLVALLMGLLVTRQRGLLWSRWAMVGVGLLILIALPNLLWQIHYSWPTLEFLHNGEVQHKNVRLGPLPFIGKQIMNLQPATFLVWGAGLIWLLLSREAKRWRWLGITYLVFLVIMMALHAKDYYVAAIYPFLFAAGGIAWERGLAHRRRVQQDRVFAFPILEAVLLVMAVIIFPLTVPVMSPAAWVRYTNSLHISNAKDNTENRSSGPLPQFYADRFGWQEEVDEVTRIYHSLSPEDQRKVGIMCSNYGEAGAIDFLGHGLPTAISGHNNYWLWGPNGATGEVMIVINGASLEDVSKSYDSVVIAGRMDNPYSMPYERRDIYLARGRKKNLSANWDKMKHYE